MTIAVRPNFQNVDRDPYYSMRSLGLHFDGSFTDNSPTPKTYTPTAANTISAEESVFGGTSSRFSGSGHASIGAHADFDFGAGDFTISQFVWFNSLSDQALLTYGNSAVNNGSNLAWRTRLVGGNIGIAIYSGTTAYQTNTVGQPIAAQRWYHFEACRAAGTLMIFLDGITVGSAAGAAAINNAASRALRFSYYASSALQYMTGYMDEVLIYKGVALHTADFRPPQRPFANR